MNRNLDSLSPDYFWLLFFCLTLSCASPTVARLPAQAQTQRKVVSTPPQVIFFIHGFRDNGDCFQQLPELLRQRYSEKNVRVKALTYPSVDKIDQVQKLSAYDFAKMINTQIINFLIEEGERDRASTDVQYTSPVNLQTPYTVVAHSQGGLVAMNYLNSCIRSPGLIVHSLNSP